MQKSQNGVVRRSYNALFAWTVLIAVAAGVLLRSWRLGWQPIWWDEGYSIYFATEPLGRMLGLTASDIHPPLYYALLHGGIGLSRMPIVEGSRLLSVFFGALALPLQYWLARKMLPSSRRTALLALLLLVFSPIHLYYSQEIRMYGLALALGLAATLAIWQWVEAHETATRRQSGWWLAAYLLAGLAALYTLYYAALLLLAHALWAMARLRKQLRSAGVLVGTYALMFLLYLPWLLYAVPRLIGYVGGKVQSDQDNPLGPLAYLERHLVAFTAGHVQPPGLPAPWLALGPATLAICAIILGLVLRQTMRESRSSRTRPARPGGGTPNSNEAHTAGALWTWLLVPVVLGWLINLRLPFFPPGGERLLLITLPYLLLLLATGMDRAWNVFHLGKLAAMALAINAVMGISAFYTTPRYTADDYRGLLRQVQQQGSDGDTLLAIFPWQVGYWRAYSAGNGTASEGPQPLLLSDTAAEWSAQVQSTIDAALQKGTLWFPEPLTFGSSLPHEIEDYLMRNSSNLENRWYDATRLTGWGLLPAPDTKPVGADFALVQLQAAGSTPSAVASANRPVAVTLIWESSQDSEVGSEGEAEKENVNVSLRLEDSSGHIWASREYERSLPQAGQVISETAGLIVPYGLPPGGYQVAVSLQTAEGEALTIAGSDAASAIIGTLEVTQPEKWPAAVRLPIQRRLERPALSDGLELLGYTGPDRDSPVQAGTELAATLFLTNHSSEPPERNLYLSLQDATGAGVAGYEGWPLAAYPTSTWPQGALAQVPAAFYVPGTVASGNYRLVAGFVDPVTGSKTAPVELATVRIEQRAANFTRPTPSHPFAEPPQLGTHARLLGYDMAPAEDGRFAVALYWEVLQPLLPSHHIFVHLDTAGGTTVAQQDGPPSTGTTAAPTGGWQPGEFLVTTHQLAGTLGQGDVVRVGLYDPVTQVRLPVTVNGQPAGDSVELQ